MAYEEIFQWVRPLMRITKCIFCDSWFKHYKDTDEELDKEEFCDECK